MSKSLIIEKPVIIIGCPRSGTSLLFRILSSSPYLWSLYRESNDIWNAYFKLSGKKFNNEVLNEDDLNNELKAFLINQFHLNTLNHYYLGYIVREYLLKNKPLNFSVDIIKKINIAYKNIFLSNYRIVEKTPKNCFRIPFINKLFNDCYFVFLKRDGRSNINSLMEGWKAEGKYVRGQAINISLNIKGYSENNGKRWKYVLPPGWENYTNKALEEVCAFQWVSSNATALDGLKKIPDDRKITVSYEDLISNTSEIIKDICYFVDIPFDGEVRKLSYRPPLVNYVTKPHKDKWKKNIDLIQNTFPIIEPMMKELGYSLSG
jgi:hypothetical protein